jgi:hypothetical protein
MKLARKDGNLVHELRALPVLDPRRLAALDPRLLKRALSNKKGVHLNVANIYDFVQDVLIIQRSQASVLPVENGEPITLKHLFKRLTRRTAVIERYPVEEIEYQCFHREAAR